MSDRVWCTNFKKSNVFLFNSLLGNGELLGEEVGDVVGGVDGLVEGDDDGDVGVKPQSLQNHL